MGQRNSGPKVTLVTCKLGMFDVQCGFTTWDGGNTTLPEAGASGIPFCSSPSNGHSKRGLREFCPAQILHKSKRIPL